MSGDRQESLRYHWEGGRKTELKEWEYGVFLAGLVTGIPPGQLQAQERKTLELLNGKNDTGGIKRRAYNPPYDLIILMMRKDLHRKQDDISWALSQGSSEVGGSPTLVYRLRRRSPDQIGGLRASSEVNRPGERVSVVDLQALSEVAGPARSFIGGRRDLEKSDHAIKQLRGTPFFSPCAIAPLDMARAFVRLSHVASSLLRQGATVRLCRALRLGARLFAPLTTLDTHGAKQRSNVLIMQKDLRRP
ncbi:hypothetical protein Acr_06g0009450 [Actinidia rufa]|uniref:Uncharacterized protein n=1 Tax=Actinidia rufa TaxID=165716 RepID=A0A7J0ER94_9ERIC|nr:hypothetical protein Acr_06g0009450 [Actinidia rufa]